MMYKVKVKNEVLVSFLSRCLQNTRILSAVCALGLGLSLAGCANLGRSPESAYFVLASSSAPALTSEQAQLGEPRVAVGPVTLPGYLDRTQLFIRQGNAVDVRVAEFHLWGEPLGEGITRVLCESMSTALAPQGAVFPLRATVPSTWQVAVELYRFEGAPGFPVILDAGWTLYTSIGEVVRQGRFVETRNAGPEIADMVRAQSELISRLGVVLGEAVQQQAMGKR